ncbi:MAG TPA: amylo-alpha-1,6-glucosidase [Dictyobacter sp.]|jgi:glycogen debranching enzyme|nr:amylo-alpha-1,6-glucosidase [Dictyobacter sp.]
MTMTLERSMCCDLNKTISREWLITNGLGGYAAGTVAGVLTRLQHGLLVATPPNTNKPQLFLAKIDEEVTFDQRTYYLGTNEYQDGTLSPSGFVHLETFRLEDGFPVFTYRLGGIDGIELEKRIWMVQGSNTTYIRYHIRRTVATEQTVYKNTGTGSKTSFSSSSSNTDITTSGQTSQPTITLTLLPFTTYRPFDTSLTDHWKFQVHTYKIDNVEKQTTIHNFVMPQTLPAGITGCTIQATEDAQPYHLLAVSHPQHPESYATFLSTGVWYWRFRYRQQNKNKQPVTDDLYLPGVIRAKLCPEDNSTLTIVVSTEELSPRLYEPEHILFTYREEILRQQENMRDVLSQQALNATSFTAGSEREIKRFNVAIQTKLPDPSHKEREYMQMLLCSANKFLTKSSIPITNFFALERKTRETLLALPGLMLSSQQHQNAMHMLRSIGTHFQKGLLPDHLTTPDRPLVNESYKHADIALWYFYAIDQYLQATRHEAFLEEIFPILQECIHHYIRGTHNGIRVDKHDGLLTAYQPVDRLTQDLNSRNEQPLYHQSGKTVALNALWYNALSLMVEWSQHLQMRGHYRYDSSTYQELRIFCKESFQQRFWYKERGYLYDVIDGPNGVDKTFRVNQIFTLSLHYPILDSAYRQQVFDKITKYLHTPYGLRTFSTYGTVYHNHRLDKHHQQPGQDQINIWPWLIGPYIDAMITIWNTDQYQNKEQPLLLQEYLWKKGQEILGPLQDLFQQKILGMCPATICEDTSQRSNTEIAYILSTTELLRAYMRLSKLHVTTRESVISY